MDVNNLVKSYKFLTIASNGFTGYTWNFGHEVWCNLKGQYLSLVSDMSSKSGQSYEISLC